MNIERRISNVNAVPQAYQGPERRAQAPAPAHWLEGMLDEVDYGVLLLSDGGRVTLMNHMARTDLDDGHPLQVLDGQLRVRDAQQADALHHAMMAAHRGQQQLVTLGQGRAAVSVAVRPLGAVGLGGARAIMLMLGKRQVCAPLSVRLFARRHGLTPSETRVLEALCEGLKPRTVAQRCNVALTTVRTHIGAIRTKVGAHGIREVLEQMAMQPPVVAALRMGR